MSSCVLFSIYVTGHTHLAFDPANHLWLHRLTFKYVIITYQSGYNKDIHLKITKTVEIWFKLLYDHNKKIFNYKYKPITKYEQLKSWKLFVSLRDKLSFSKLETFWAETFWAMCQFWKLYGWKLFGRKLFGWKLFVPCCHFWKLYGRKLFGRKLFGRIPYKTYIRTRFAVTPRCSKSGQALILC